MKEIRAVLRNWLHLNAEADSKPLYSRRDCVSSMGRDLEIFGKRVGPIGPLDSLRTGAAPVGATELDGARRC